MVDLALSAGTCPLSPGEPEQHAQMLRGTFSSVQLTYSRRQWEMSPGNDFINTTYDISLDSRTSDRCSKRILSVFWNTGPGG